MVMESQGFRERCEYELIRQELEVLFGKYHHHGLNSSAAYVESGNLLEYDPLCAEAMFFRFYALRKLLRPEKNQDFFAHAGRPEVRLLKQMAISRVMDMDYPMEDEGKLHYYLCNRQELLDLCSREFYGYVQEVYVHGSEALLVDVMQKIRLFEGIYLDDWQLFQDDGCKRWLEPYLPYILEMIGGLKMEYLPRLHDIFAKVSVILAARKQDAARKNNEEKEIMLQVLEAELADIVKDTNLFRQIGYK